MTLLGLILIALSKVVKLLCDTYTLIVVASAIISWVRPDPYNPIVTFLDQATRPVYRRLRPHLPKVFYSGQMDFTPIVIIVLLILIDTIIGDAFADWGYKLRYGRF